jgi:hypothetical protein
MIIVGGCYRELCESPLWNCVLGSGGRAAVVLAGLAPNVRLVTYRPEFLRQDLYPIEVQRVSVTAQPSATEVVFSYLHPLSQPAIVPRFITKEDPLLVDGELVLRFGMIEGDAIVTAKRAVYDPQNERPAAFTANGSKAEQLAIVLNELELRQLGKSEDIHVAANHILKSDNAAVVVAKCGVKGAWVFTLNGTPQWISAYRSSSIFKIGTGDVFSAVFAYHWMGREVASVEAATLASQSVAAYAASRILPVRLVDGGGLRPIGLSNSGVVVLGDTTTLADRWLREEAVSRLMDLGVNVRTATANTLPTVGGLLLLADGLPGSAASIVSNAIAAGLFVVVFQQRNALPAEQSASVQYTDDFTTALYWIAWGNAQRMQ